MLIHTRLVPHFKLYLIEETRLQSLIWDKSRSWPRGKGTKVSRRITICPGSPLARGLIINTVSSVPLDSEWALDVMQMNLFHFIIKIN